MYIGSIGPYRVYVYKGKISIPNIMIFPFRIIVKIGTAEYYNVLRYVR